MFRYSPTPIFLKQALEHLCDRATGRERQTYHRYQVWKDPAQHKVFARIPEEDPWTNDRHTPPAETFVLVGTYENSDSLKWIRSNGIYCFPIGMREDSLKLRPELIGVKYLLLVEQKVNKASGFWRVSKAGISLVNSETLVSMNYPEHLETNTVYGGCDMEAAVSISLPNFDSLAAVQMIDIRFPIVITLDRLLAKSDLT